MAACRHVRIVNFGLHMRTFRGSEECTAVVIRASVYSDQTLSLSYYMPPTEPQPEAEHAAPVVTRRVQRSLGYVPPLHSKQHFHNTVRSNV